MNNDIVQLWKSISLDVGTLANKLEEQGEHIQMRFDALESEVQRNRTTLRNVAQTILQELD